MDADNLISTILKHDAKQTSYKIALLRAINDVVLSFPDLRRQTRDVAIPLTVLAEFWVAYYWPFVSQARPILQGVRSRLKDNLRVDMAFRPELTALREVWLELHGGVGGEADGFYLTNELRLPRKRSLYPQAFLSLYALTLKRIADGIRQPIQYAGPGQWQVFNRPVPYRQVASTTACIPGTKSTDVCVVVPASLWQAFQKVSLWVEALCIHEWSLFTEGVQQEGTPVGRGEVYTLLTERPGNRLPLTWERNSINLLLDEGKVFTCPWTYKSIHKKKYHLDHLVPVSLYPFNELWNLMPADPSMNIRKGNRLPGQERLDLASPHLTLAYEHYASSSSLALALKQEAKLRFSALQDKDTLLPQEVTLSVINLIRQLADSRNVARF